MIIETMDESQFIKRFEDYNRTGNFSYPALRVLFNYLNDLSDDMGEPIELDVIGICVDYTEYTKNELLNEYSFLFEHLDPKEYESEEEYLEECLEELNNNTHWLLVEHHDKEDTYIIGAF